LSRKEVIDEVDYKQLVRLLARQIANNDVKLSEYAFNTNAKNIVNIDFFINGYLSKENAEFLRSYLIELGKAEFMQNVDLLSQMLMKLELPKERKRKKREKIEKLFEI